MMESVRINVFSYISCFGNLFDNKYPEFPVALPLQNDVGSNGITVFFDMLKKNDVCMYMIDKADYSGLITVSSWEQKAKCVVRCIV
jgi:hypothetical protein